MCSGLVKLCHYAITTKSAKPQKNVEVLFRVMAWVHLINKDTEPFAKYELDPVKVKWEATHQFGIDHLEQVVSKTERWALTLFHWSCVKCLFSYTALCRYVQSYYKTLQALFALDHLLLPTFIQLCPLKEHSELVSVLPPFYVILSLQKKFGTYRLNISDSEVTLSWWY